MKNDTELKGKEFIRSAFAIDLAMMIMIIAEEMLPEGDQMDCSKEGTGDVEKIFGDPNNAKYLIGSKLKEVYYAKECLIMRFVKHGFFDKYEVELKLVWEETDKYKVVSKVHWK